MLICPLDNQNSLQILFFSDSLCFRVAKSCLIIQLSSFLFIMSYFVQNKNRHLQEKQTYVVVYPFTTSTQDFYQKKIIVK